MQNLGQNFEKFWFWQKNFDFVEKIWKYFFISKVSKIYYFDEKFRKIYI